MKRKKGVRTQCKKCKKICSGEFFLVNTKKKFIESRICDWVLARAALSPQPCRPPPVARLLEPRGQGAGEALRRRPSQMALLLCFESSLAVWDDDSMTAPAEVRWRPRSQWQAHAPKDIFEITQWKKKKKVEKKMVKSWHKLEDPPPSPRPRVDVIICELIKKTILVFLSKWWKWTCKRYEWGWCNRLHVYVCVYVWVREYNWRQSECSNWDTQTHIHHIHTHSP